jgi:large subunit ribosomal protein L18
MAVAMIRRRLRLKRKFRVKNRVQKDKTKLRLAVYKSLNHIYAQIIDDIENKTLASESTLSKAFKETSKKAGNIDAAKWVGASLGKKAIEKGVKEVYCDRGGFIYHGRIKALADSVREAGVKF